MAMSAQALDDKSDRKQENRNNETETKEVRGKTFWNNGEIEMSQIPVVKSP